MPKGQGFKKTGGGPKYGSFSFPSGAGFTHSGTSKQNVKGYTRSTPKKKFAHGGMVTAPMASGDSAVVKRAKPVTGFDAEHGGKGSLRPGFNKGGKACYAEGGKVNTMGQAISMVKRLMAQGNSPADAAAKAARRFGVSPQQLKTAPTGGGGLPAEKQMLARGGVPTKGGRTLQGSGPVLDGMTRMDMPYGQRMPMPAPQGQKVPMAPPARSGMMTNHGMPSGSVTRPGRGSFGRTPLFK